MSDRVQARRVKVGVDVFQVYAGRLDWLPVGFQGPGARGEYGNYATGRTREEKVANFERAFRDRVRRDHAYAGALRTLRGQSFGCWCAPHQQCHADVIVDWLNTEGLPARSDSDVLCSMVARFARSAE